MQTSDCGLWGRGVGLAGGMSPLRVGVARMVAHLGSARGDCGGSRGVGVRIFVSDMARVGWCLGSAGGVPERQSGGAAEGEARRGCGRCVEYRLGA